MDPEDTVLLLPKVPSLSSSVQSTPEKNVHSDDVSKSPELLQDFVKLVPKKELIQNCSDQVKINSASSKGKMKEHSKPSNRTTKKHDSRKGSNSPSTQTSSKKQNRKGGNPSRIITNVEQPSDFGCSKSWICKNSACRAVLSMDDAFCKRCSCCICHLFDDNKDPSLWLVCSSESGSEDSCGLSCHIECALQLEKVGVVDLGQLMRLDGSYCCASCGKVSGIIGNLKKQLVFAKDARRVDVLRYRIYLSYRLLDGTSRFKELHEIVKVAKTKLETEVGPVDGVSLSTRTARGIVSRLSVAGAVQDLCSLGIEKADEWLASVTEKKSICREDSLPAACKFLFEEISASSVTIILIELSKALPEEIKGYKLWYSRSREETRREDPVCTFNRDQRRIKITHLQPCSQYTFRIMSYTESGDLGYSEAKCFTKSIEIIHKNRKSSLPTTTVKVDPENSSSGLPGFKVRDLAKVLNLGWTKEQQCYLEESLENIGCEVRQGISPANETRDQLPDLNEEFPPPFNSSPDEDTASHDEEKNNLIGSHGSRESLTWTGGEVSAVDSQREDSKKRGADEVETHDCNSTLINESPTALDSDSSGGLDENFEYCVKIIRWLEREGHINHDFRLRLLTWFSLRSTEQERRVVNTFIQTMIDDPVILAGQLVDSFSDMVSCKRPRVGPETSSDKLWQE